MRSKGRLREAWVNFWYGIGTEGSSVSHDAGKSTVK